MNLDEIFFHGREESLCVVLWWDDSGIVTHFGLFVHILNLFHYMVRSHEINDSQSQIILPLILILDDQ